MPCVSYISAAEARTNDLEMFGLQSSRIQRKKQTSVVQEFLFETFLGMFEHPLAWDKDQGPDNYHSHATIDLIQRHILLIRAMIK